MEEVVILDTGNVKVTNSRFIVDGQTYAMNGVTSVRNLLQKPDRRIPGLLIFLGFIAIPVHILISIVLWGIAGYIWFKQKPGHCVLLSTSSGEARALTSKDEDFVNKIIEAVNQAIIQRG